MNRHPLHVLANPVTTFPYRFTDRHHVPILIHVHKGIPPSCLPMDPQGQANEGTRPIWPQGVLFRVQFDSKRLRIRQEPGPYHSCRSWFSQVNPQMSTTPTRLKHCWNTLPSQLHCQADQPP